MLSGIFGKKSDHPLADIRSAQKLLDDLPRNDVHKLLMDLAEMLGSVAENTDFKLEHQFAVLRLIDEAAQPYTRKLIAEYFTPRVLSAFQENRLWLVLGNYFRQSAIAYCTVFDRQRNAEKGNQSIKAQVPLLLARAVYAMNWQLKFICAHYDLVEHAIWENLANILNFAEQQQCQDAQVNLYPGTVGNTTVKCEVGRLLGWYGSGVNSLSPVHMHLTERILAQYCSDIVIRDRQDESSMFGFDLNDPGAPLRTRVNTDGSWPSMRFVNMQDMLPKLERLMKTLEKNIVPDELALGGSYGAELIKEAVRHLLIYFNGPPMRRSVRRVIKINFNVANSFSEVTACIKDGLSFSRERPVWSIEDISATGFLTVLPAQGSDNIRIGSLLGMQLEGVLHWGVAVVRRLLRSDTNELHVGAEIIATQVTGVALRQSGGGVAGFENGQIALWLYEKNGEKLGDASGETKLLMKAGAFSTNRSLQTHFNGKNCLLIPTGLQEKYIDCDLGRFRVVEQEQDED